MNEDTYVVAKMLLAGWRNRYVGNAKVYHSHDYTYTEDFRRAFDIGVFHGKESWLRADFGAAEGEGLRYVLSEAQYLWKHAAAYIPSAFVRNFVKLLGYRLGIMEAWLPRSWKEHMSMNSGFWRK
jgi:rhamnosyltransferase